MPLPSNEGTYSSGKKQYFKLYFVVVRLHYFYSKLKPINHKINYINILTIVSCRDKTQHNTALNCINHIMHFYFWHVLKEYKNNLKMK